jgi:radical SAM superfamily enzyme YgiQ (UPF0313 family)
VRGVVLFPAPYAVGMASLAVNTLYAALNDPPTLACERAFASPPPRNGSRLPPTRTVESGRRLADCDFIALTSSYELDWPAIPALLAAGGVPPLRRDRAAGPLVLAGGPAVTASPLPLAEIYDAALVGEIEPVLANLRAALALGDRNAALQRLAEVPGFYVPAYHERPAAGCLPRRCALDLDTFETASVILTPDCEFPDRFLLEMGRGCGRGCSFCLARQVYRPLRWRSVEATLRTARRALTQTPDLGLIAAAVSDHPQLPELCAALTDLSPELQVSTSSLRLETASPELLSLLARGGQHTVTYAPEAATEGLRAAIGKALPESELMAAVERALAAGLTRVRLYFMLGLPGETPADREALPELAQRLTRAFPALHLRLTLSAFSPRPHTPFEDEPLAAVSDLRRWLADTARSLGRLPRVQVTTASAREAALQCALGRADERLGLALAAAPGATWGELRPALQQHGLRFEDLLGPQTPAAERPWKVVAPRCWDKATSP